MITDEIRTKYQPAIGIECHVQLKTKTKLFAAVDNDARQAAPNTLVSHICFGLPGSLPVLNEAAVRLATRAAFALGTEPQRYSEFERKHYFYPDLPMGYQISQLHHPIIVGGFVAIDRDGQPTSIRINRVQIEADAGKNTHPTNTDYSLVDLNRAGTPLLEIVSEPDLHSAAEAKAYARELYLRMRYADVSDANLYYGNMRFDVNVSVSKKAGELGTRSETKNLNSFRAVEKAVEFEIKRQIELLEKGEKIIQETRGWDDVHQKTTSLRSKEEAHDYRYMPDPDLPPIVLDDDFISAIKSKMPVMPEQWRQRLSSLGLDDSQTETLLDAELEWEGVDFLPLLEEHLSDPDYARQLANWFVNIEVPLRRSDSAVHLNHDAERLKLYQAVYQIAQAGKLSSTKAKALIREILQLDSVPKDIVAFAKGKGYQQMSDEGELQKIVLQIIAAHPEAAADVRKGELKAIGFLVGQVMKQSKGQANPTVVQALIKKHLIV